MVCRAGGSRQLVTGCRPGKSGMQGDQRCRAMPPTCRPSLAALTSSTTSLGTAPRPELRPPADRPDQLLHHAVLEAVDDAVHRQLLPCRPGRLHHGAGAHVEHLALDVELAQPAGGRCVALSELGQGSTAGRWARGQAQAGRHRQAGGPAGKQAGRQAGWCAQQHGTHRSSWHCGSCISLSSSACWLRQSLMPLIQQLTWPGVPHGSVRAALTAPQL